jgi:hypothetical protein
MSGYIGTQPVPQSTQTRDSFTATSGQTSFATGGYQSGYIDLYLNGIKLAAADYTATNNSDVVLAVGAATGDILEVVAYTAFNTANVTGAVDFTVTNNIVVGGTVDGVDIAARDAVLTSTTTTSNAALPKSGGTMTGDITRGGTVIQDGTITDTGDFTLDVAGDIILDAAGEDIFFKANGTTFGQITTSSGDLHILQPTSDKDILFRGLDGSTYINALTLDMSDAGTAIFNHDAQFPDGAQVRLGADNDMKLHLDGTTAIFGAQNGDMLLDSAADIILDADGGDVIWKDGGSEYARFTQASGGLRIQTVGNNADFVVLGNDGGYDVAAMTLDMSEAGAATFNAAINAPLVQVGEIYEQTHGADINVTMVSEDAGIAIMSRSANVGHTPYIQFQKTPATSGNYTATGNGDFLGVINFTGVNTSNGADLGAAIQVKQTGTASATVPSEMQFFTTEAQRMTIDAGGAVTTPYQPAFKANADTQTNLGSGWQKILYDTSKTARNATGSTSYSGSSSRFTAPVNGWYFFSASYNATANTDADGTLVIGINGSESNVVSSTSAPSTSGHTYNAHFCAGSAYLALNDYVEVFRYSTVTTTTRTSLPYGGWFSGHLIG